MKEVLVEIFETRVALLRLNRPEKKNAINCRVREQLASQFDSLSVNQAVRVIVLTGTEDVFAAGADLEDLRDASPVQMLMRKTHLRWQAISRCPKPIIAAVNGYALGGGCELAMHADIIVAGESASFGQPEIRVGLMPGAGGTQRLIRAVGKYKALKMLLTGNPVTAIEAERMGLVSEVVADSMVLTHAMTLAETIARRPPLAIQQIKEVVLAGQDITLNSALMLEEKAFQLLFDSKDKTEGIDSFFEKRRPHYSGE